MRDWFEACADVIGRAPFTSRGDAISSVCTLRGPAGNAKINPKLLLNST